MSDRAVRRADPLSYPLREGSKATRQQPRRHFERHPLEVVRVWAGRLREGDVDGALALYTREAVLHADGRDITGRSHLDAWLESSPLLKVRVVPELRGDGSDIVARWRKVGLTDIEARSRVVDGAIAEQRIALVDGTTPLPARAEGEPVAIAVVTRGAVDRAAIDYATERLRDALDPVKDHVLFARMKLTRAADPARDRPAIAEISVDVEGDVVRAQVAGHELREAADLLHTRLRDKLDHRRQRRAARRARKGTSADGEWRHGDLPTARPAYFDRAPDERELVRHKVFVVDDRTEEEAAFDLEQLDYDFLLFREVASGADALLERGADGTYRLTRLDAAPLLGVAEALRRLDDGGERFLFFADARTRRGNVVYVRYDGQYGLLSPDER